MRHMQQEKKTTNKFNGLKGHVCEMTNRLSISLSVIQKVAMFVSDPRLILCEVGFLRSFNATHVPSIYYMHTLVILNFVDNSSPSSLSTGCYRPRMLLARDNTGYLLQLARYCILNFSFDNTTNCACTARPSER